jgi:hypothetical protein
LIATAVKVEGPPLVAVDVSVETIKIILDKWIIYHGRAI